MSSHNNLTDTADRSERTNNSLLEHIANAPNRISKAKYVTAEREYTRYYVELHRVPKNIVFYIDSTTGEIVADPISHENNS